MYKQNKMQETNFDINTSVEGESVEEMVERFVNNNEKVDIDTKNLKFQSRQEGVNKAYNIRTDRWDVAIEAIDKSTMGYIASRQNLAETEEIDKVEPAGNDTQET